jgi:quercetin dioxygenase-like cupin family protein
MAMEQPHLAAGEGERVSLRGTEVVFKAAGHRAGGGPTVLEFITAPGFATGDHVHRTIEEIFCVLDGEFAIRAGDRTERVGPGGVVRVPPGMVHGFGNPGSATATLLLIISPAGVHEDYFRELAAILAQPGAPDAAAIGALRARYDTEQVSALTA